MQRDVPIVEVFLSFVSIWWAVVLFTNKDLLTNRLPDYMQPLSSLQEIGWGFIFLAAAIVKFTGLITLQVWVRRVGLGMSMTIYSLICAGYILSDRLLHTGTGVYFLLTVLAWWGFREVKHYERG